MGNFLMGLKATKAKIAYSVDGTAPPEFHAPEHLPPGSDPIILPADITAGQFVKWEGAKLIGAAAGVANQFTYYTAFDSVDGFTKQIPTAITFANAALHMVADPSDIVILEKEIDLTPIPLNWDKNKVLQFASYIETPGDDTFWGDIFIGSNDLSEVGIGIAFTRNEIRGWCNDGAGRTYLDLITGLADNWCEYHSYEIRTFPPTYVEFYVDGVLIDKIQTHIPSGHDFASTVFEAYAKSGASPGLTMDLYIFKHVQDL
jgi:hypothetical protein